MLVDLNCCQGYGQCALLAPATFDLRGEENLMYNPAPDETQHLAVLRAVAACPVQAIRVALELARGSALATTGRSSGNGPGGL